MAGERAAVCGRDWVRFEKSEPAQHRCRGPSDGNGGPSERDAGVGERNASTIHCGQVHKPRR